MGQSLWRRTRRSTRLTLSSSGDDLGLSDSLGLSGGRERLLELDGEGDVLDEDRLDRDSPLGGDALDDGLDLGGDGLPVREDALEIPRSNYVPQRRLRALDERETDVGDSERGLEGVDDVVVDDRVDVDADVVLGHDRLGRTASVGSREEEEAEEPHLLGNVGDLNLHFRGQRDETQSHDTPELTLTSTTLSFSE